MSTSDIDQHIIQHRAKQLNSRLIFFSASVLLLLTFIAGITIIPSHQPTVVPSKVSPTPLSEEEQHQLRLTFNDALVDFTQHLQPLQDTPALVHWQSHAFQAVDKEKSAALTAYAQQEYQSAISQIQQAKEMALSAHTAWQEAREQALVNVQKALKHQQIPQAQRALNQAKMIHPSHSQITTLQTRIDNAPRITRLLQQYQIAQVENNDEHQRQHLTALIALSPEREDLHTALAQLNQRDKTTRFQQSIEHGFAALTQNNLDDAQRYYDKAAALSPQHEALSLLAQRLQQQRQTQQDTLIQQHFHTLVNNEQWDATRQYAQQVLTRRPHHDLAQYHQQQATAIMQLQQQLTSFIQQPKRLIDQHIQRQAQRLIEQAQPYTPVSRRLKNQSLTLTDLIQQAQHQYPVTLLSDGHTDIYVLGTGKVGKIEQKTVSLSAGEHVLEGRCQGYHHVRVTINVKAHHSLSPITILCHEPL